MNNIDERLSALENKVANLKYWKIKYEELETEYNRAKQEWTKEKSKLDTDSDIAQLRSALIKFLRINTQPINNTTAKETVNLIHKELEVNLSHEVKVLELTTNTVVGKVLYSALNNLSKDGFSEAELSDILQEYGWNIGHSTLAPTLGSLVRDGYLVKLDNTRPAKYRLPTKVTMNIKKEL